MTYFVYMVQCADNTLYTGFTNNLQKRLRAHNYLKSGAQYTKTRRPVQFVFTQACESEHDAKVREAQIKKLTRKQKLELCATATLLIE